ncbi:hypothetical protein SDC9_125279 [bioreactor metagenome]|uniref:Folate transporter FolT n=1 Tax=bioreactor metagenome TaxID=1076179 RepID=A0A645CMY3_9ZZZZ|nr:folate family ECF transporter S component [Candidatus Metalachnospira sp.]
MKEIGLKDRFKGEKLSSPKTLTGVAMLVALYTILSFFTLNISATAKIGFAYLALGVCGMMFGPIAGGIAGAAGDVLGYFVNPNGPFFPGFTISAFIMGFLFGIVLYKKPITIKRTMIAVLVVMVVCNTVLTPIWLNLMYGSSLIALPRIIRNILLYPVNVALMHIVLKGVHSFRKSIA